MPLHLVSATDVDFENSREIAVYLAERAGL